MDLTPFLRKLISGAPLLETDWSILWDDLHHQGDVGEASYAVIPYLVEYARTANPIAWHAFGFPAVVELARGNPENPPIPEELELDYKRSFVELARIALGRGAASWDEECFEPAMACIALSFARRQHAQLYLDATESEIPEFYKYYYGGDP